MPVWLLAFPFHRERNYFAVWLSEPLFLLRRDIR